MEYLKHRISPLLRGSQTLKRVSTSCGQPCTGACSIAAVLPLYCTNSVPNADEARVEAKQHSWAAKSWGEGVVWVARRCMRSFVNFICRGACVHA